MCWRLWVCCGAGGEAYRFSGATLSPQGVIVDDLAVAFSSARAHSMASITSKTPAKFIQGNQTPSDPASKIPKPNAKPAIQCKTTVLFIL